MRVAAQPPATLELDFQSSGPTYRRPGISGRLANVAHIGTFTTMKDALLATVAASGNDRAEPLKSGLRGSLLAPLTLSNSYYIVAASVVGNGPGDWFGALAEFHLPFLFSGGTLYTLAAGFDRSTTPLPPSTGLPAPTGSGPNPAANAVPDDGITAVFLAASLVMMFYVMRVK